MNTYRISRRSKYYPERPFTVAGEVDAVSKFEALSLMKIRLRDRLDRDFEYQIDDIK